MSKDNKYPVSDLKYAVVTTLSNLLQGSETLAKYVEDAEKAGDQEAAAVFRKIHESYDGHALELDAVLRRLDSGKS
jgi:rubrerythrin